MTTPRRFAALAVCLVALAAGASAACVPGSINVELVGTTDTNHELAKCLSSAIVSIDVDCKVSINATATDNSFVQALWSSDAGSYKQLKLCPATSAKAVFDTDAAKSLALAFNGYIYGFNSATPPAALKESGVTGVTFPAAGRMVVAFGTSDTLTYAIRAKSATTSAIHATNAVVVTDGTTSGFDTTEFKSADDAGLDCDAGRYGMLVGDIKLCPLCPAGTTGDGNGCTACPAGKASDAVGVTDTTGCTAVCHQGYFSQTGSSDCLPCPMHTYSGTSGTDGVAECTACAPETYAWIPGSTACLRCVNGIPTTATTTAPSAGSHILSVTANMGSCDVDALQTTDAGYGVPAWQKCATWQSGTVTLMLALEVAGDCSINIKPIGDDTCSDPGAVLDAFKLTPLTTTEKYTYTYNNLVMRAYYTSTTKIRSLLPSTVDGASSFMVAIDQDTTAVKFEIFAATNLPAQNAIPSTKKCTAAVAVAGGTVASITKSGACPAGTYGDDASTPVTCTACPPGKTCGAGVTSGTDCAAATANPYLGQSTGCTSCSPDTSRVTSYAGAAYCTIPYFDRNCAVDVTVNSVLIEYSKGGYEWDESAAACVKCRPGTYRSTAMLPLGATPNPECQECPAGTYSGEGAFECTPCPAGQYNPSTGMADQQVGTNGIRCLLCPTGSIALRSSAVATTADDIANFLSDTISLNEGADTCDACPEGTYASAATYSTTAAKGCSKCPSGWFRTGDASLNNNECKKIPAGYKGISFKDDSGKTGAYAIEACAAGSVSYWVKDDTKFGKEARVPADAPHECKLCSSDNGGSGKSNTYAPRTGMAACLACKGGFEPNDQHTACVSCAVGYYRSFYEKSASCAACAAGSEVGPSSRQACTLCRPGSYKTDLSDGTNDKDYCDECPVNTYMPKPGASGDIGLANGCIWCPKGQETQDKGNTECTPCAVGWYNPKVASSSAAPACIKAPAGTYVNTTGAFIATQCPLGTYNPDTAQDSCEPCPPGQYANTLGNKACKTCPAGTYSGGQAATCKPCAAGYYAPAGSGACSPCKPGTYANLARAGTCTLCPKGSQCPTPATVSPKPCPAGTYSAKDGSQVCTPCPVNFVSTVSGSRQCTACAKGTNTRGLTGQKTCTAVRVTSLRRSVL